MTGGFILSAVFLVLAVTVLLLMIFGKIELFSSFRKYYVMSAAVYLSGTALIFVFFLIVKELPLIFAVISELCILTVFVISVWAIRKMGKAVMEIKGKNETPKTEE